MRSVCRHSCGRIRDLRHDGFALWDSKVSDWDIIDGSPFDRDILKELAEACRRHGIRLCFYHSIMDWHHPDAQTAFYPWYNSRQGMAGIDREGEFAGDYGTPEQEIPDTGLAGVDWESCMTMNDTWGWKSSDSNWKSSEELIRNLVDIVSKGGNYLLNVGPTHEGYIPRPSIERLKSIGDWLRVNGEAVYGTQASPFEQPSWKGRYTVTDDALYAIVFERPNGPDGWLNIPQPEGFSPQSKAILLATGEELEVTSDQGMIYVDLPDVLPDTNASVVKITLH